jgi:hypothetical protein
MAVGDDGAPEFPIDNAHNNRSGFFGARGYETDRLPFPELLRRHEVNPMLDAVGAAFRRVELEHAT